MPFVTFDAPTEARERNEAPPGHELAQSLARGIRESGLLIRETVHQHDSYGWSFVVSGANQPTWCVLQLSDTWMVVVKQKGSFLGRLFGGSHELDAERQIARAVAEAARGLPGVSNVRLFETDRDLREERETR